jgi:protein SFI1
MTNRALKHLARQDAVLITAVTRVWKARERAKLLERVKVVRLLKGAWALWIRRMQAQKRLEGRCRPLLD